MKHKSEDLKLMMAGGVFMLKVERLGVSWNVSGKYSESWFERNLINGSWEDGTYDVINRFQDKGGVMVDIGSWIGPISLFASQLFGRVISFEPDEVAFKLFEENLRVNNFTNISPINKGISEKNGTIRFGGNGRLGNSESTMMLDEISVEGEVVEVEVVKLEEAISELSINPKEISICKMDIEGGEKIVIPAIINFLKEYNIPLYISLHWGILEEEDIEKILILLFSNFDRCRYSRELGRTIEIDEILRRQAADLVFVNHGQLDV